MSDAPIAVFDSGLGGLSVVRQLQALLPAEDIVYFGDTARVPYGSKSKQTVAVFALEAARFLLNFEPKVLIAACNTASALALDTLTSSVPTPVLGVVEPGARAAVTLCQEGTIGVLGTEATINSGAYPRAIRALRVNADVYPLACPLLVPLVEEGRTHDDPITQLAVATYLGQLPASVRVVVLGCTHYPLLRDAIAAHLPAGVHLVDSGRETSLAARETLDEMGGLSGSRRIGTIRCYVSDNPARFRRVGSRFLEQEIEHVEFVPPERYIGSVSLERLDA